MEIVGTRKENSPKQRRPKTAGKEPIQSTDSLVKLNRGRLKKLFIEQSCGKKMSFHQFFKFCKDCLIIPKLGSILEVKKAYSKFCENKNLQWRLEDSPTLAYSHFEELLQFLAEQIITELNDETSPLEKLFYHIKGPIKLQYKQDLLFEEHKAKIMPALYLDFPSEKARSGSQMLCREPETPTHSELRTPEEDIYWTERPLRCDSVDIREEINPTGFLQDAETSSGNNLNVVDNNIDLALRVLNLSKDLQHNKIGYQETSFDQKNESRAFNPFRRHTHKKTDIKFRSSFSIERKPQLQHKFSFEQSELRTERSPIILHNINNKLIDKELETKASRVGTILDDSEDLKEFLKIEQSLNNHLYQKRNLSLLPESKQESKRANPQNILKKDSAQAQPFMTKEESSKKTNIPSTSNCIGKSQAKYDFSTRIMGKGRKYNKTKTINLNQAQYRGNSQQNQLSSSPKQNLQRQSNHRLLSARSAVTFSLPKYAKVNHVKKESQTNTPRTKHDKVAVSRINISRTSADCCASLVKVKTFKTPTQQSAPEGFFLSKLNCSDSKRRPLIRIEDPIDQESIDSTQNHIKSYPTEKVNDISSNLEGEENKFSHKLLHVEMQSSSGFKKGVTHPSIHQNLIFPSQTIKNDSKDLKDITDIDSIANAKEKLLISQAEKLHKYKNFIKNSLKGKSKKNAVLLKSIFRSWFSFTKQQAIKLSLELQEVFIQGDDVVSSSGIMNRRIIQKFIQR